MARVLVAGATGYLGSFVVKELKTRGYYVRALARAPEKLVGFRDQIDAVHIGQVTKADTLEGICEGIDFVFSSIGITKQRDGLTFQGVDYQGNMNLLDEAKRSGVRKFVYVSALDGPALYHLAIVKAHEDFVQELKSSGLDYAVIRPTGYFSDMGVFFDMARKGRVFLIGSGHNRVNPIHGADLAVVCANVIEGDKKEINVGGPETMSWRQVAMLAFEMVNKPVKITTIPVWLMNSIKFMIRLISRHKAELMDFFIAVSTRDIVGPPTGSHTLRAHYEKLEAAE